MKHNGCALHHASAELHNDREVVLAAVQQEGDALEERMGGCAGSDAAEQERTGARVGRAEKRS